MTFEEILKLVPKGIAITDGKVVLLGRFKTIEEAEARIRSYNNNTWYVIEIK